MRKHEASESEEPIRERDNERRKERNSRNKDDEPAIGGHLPSDLHLLTSFHRNPSYVFVEKIYFTMAKRRYASRTSV